MHKIIKEDNYAIFMNHVQEMGGSRTRFLHTTRILFEATLSDALVLKAYKLVNIVLITV